MSSLLQHPLTGEWVLYAPSRGERPGAFEPRRPRTRTRPQDCPFCPGNEEETPPEIERAEEPGRWRIRVVPNRYPAVAEGEGAHEVVIESPDHDSRFHSLAADHAAEIVTTYRRRFTAHSRKNGISFVTVFKNDGPDSGQSIDHLHSQVLALPVVPPRAALIANGFAAGCPLCQSLSNRKQYVLQETENAVAVAPEIALFPYEIWVLPRRHAPTFEKMSPAETADLAHLMQNASRAFAALLDDASFNWVFHNSAVPEKPEFHWFLQAFPRIAQQGGFELGSGMQINVVNISRAADELRKAMKR